MNKKNLIQLYLNDELEYEVYEQFGRYYAVKKKPYAWLPTGRHQDDPLPCKHISGYNWKIDGREMAFNGIKINE